MFRDIADVFWRIHYLQMFVPLFLSGVSFFPRGGNDAGKGGKRCLKFSLWLLPISDSLLFGHL